MTKFLVLYRSSVNASEQMSAATPEQAQEGMQMWMRWAEKAGPALVDLGSPLGGSAFVPSADDASAGTPIGGFSVLEAESRAKLDGLLGDHPHLHSPGAAIEVLEFLPIPGV
jgi:hypothetical protein